MRKAITTPLYLALLAGFASADTGDAVLVSSDITTSTTWTADNCYNLTTQIYVTNGATLTIEPGTVIASTATVNGSGALAVTRGSQINVMGTASAPVIMTSTNDTATWVNGDPKSGVWREAANEWGNLTIMGNAFISEDVPGGVLSNVPTCNASNVGTMEGLTEAFPGDTRVLYGGGNDNDDSGTINYLSLRYGGRVTGLANELNGLSLGGIGRGTDIRHVEIMNNVDDGVEIWGGTVNLKNVAIWNVGDDSFDVDQGWRGKAQFVLIVQGYSLNASQGSGVGDNCFEVDGAENSDWQPVTTASIYNATVIGQPLGGDGGTAWRDSAHVQYRKSIFMDLGEQLVRFDNIDGDGGLGYGFGGTLSWPDVWTTPFNMPPAHPNDCPPGTYLAQTTGFLAQIADSVFFRNLAGNAYTEATARGVFAPANNNVLIPGFATADSPIRCIERGAPVVKGGLTMLQVIGLDPRATNEAATSVTTIPMDGFYSRANYRGAFSPRNNWLCGWSASDAFGFLKGCDIAPTAAAPSNGGSIGF